MPETAVHVTDDGKVIDPTTNKVRILVHVRGTLPVQNFEHLEAQPDPPPPDISVICFQNSEIWYFSYDPPKGTAEEIMQFRGAVLKKIQRRDEMGTLELRGDDRL